jgi:hypothetical protein
VEDVGIHILGSFGIWYLVFYDHLVYQDISGNPVHAYLHRHSKAVAEMMLNGSIKMGLPTVETSNNFQLF